LDLSEMRLGAFWLEFGRLPGWVTWWDGCGSSKSGSHESLFRFQAEPEQFFARFAKSVAL